MKVKTISPYTALTFGFYLITIYWLKNLYIDTYSSVFEFSVFVALSAFFFLSKSQIKFQNKIIQIISADSIPFFIFLFWCLSLLIGVRNGATPRDSFKNFYTSFFFLFTYFFYFKITDKLNTTKLLLHLGVTSNFLIIFSLFFNPYFHPGLIGKSRIMFSPLQAFAFFLFPFSLNSFLNTFTTSSKNMNTRFLYLLGLFVSFFNVVVLSLSGGFILASVIIVLFIFANHEFLKGLIKKRLCLIILLNIVIITLMTKIIFSSADTNNSVRYSQVTQMMSEFIYWGNGLGKGLASGYYSDPVNVYNYESTFFNIIHKQGLLAIPLYIFLFQIIARLFKYKNTESQIVSMGALGVLCISIGNNFLFFPSSIILLCTCRHLLANEEA